MTISWDYDTLPFCCGIREVGNFGRDYSDNHEDTPEEAVNEMMSQANGRPILFNFVKERNYNKHLNDSYNARELRTYVMAHPKAKHVVKFINPGSGNRIDCWMISDYKEIELED
jgi:hypothetical protein